MNNTFLYDYQLDAIRKMHNGCILCGGVGSGKSRTSLAYYFLKNGGDVSDFDYCPMTNEQDLYIITTARKRDTHDWEAEYLPFLLNTEMYNCKVYVDSWNNIKKYSDVKNAFFIFDEQRVVGWGVWTKAFLKISKSNEWILLSATPGDTWSDYIPVFVANGFYSGKTDFCSQHIVYKYGLSYPVVDRYIATKKLEHFRDALLVNMDFKRPTTSNHITKISEFDVKKYKDIYKNRWNPFTDEPIKTPAELCLCLRRVVNEDKSRLDILEEIYSEHPRLIVFYNFNYELDYILKYGCFEFNGSAAEVAQWNGHKHEPIPSSNYWVYLVQYAACEGWNCIQTDTIVFYSMNYSYKVMTQAAGRIDRLNTPFSDLYYYHIRSKSSIDISINRALEEKKDFEERKFARRFEQKT